MSPNGQLSDNKRVTLASAPVKNTQEVQKIHYNIYTILFRTPGISDGLPHRNRLGGDAMQDEARSLLWQDGTYEARVTWQQEADPSRLAQAAARLLAALAGQDAAPP